MAKIKDIPKVDRPREKLIQKGKENLVCLYLNLNARNTLIKKNLLVLDFLIKH